MATLTGTVIPGTIFLLAVYFRLRHRLQQRGRRTAAAFLVAAFALELVLSLGYTAAHPIILGHRNAERITQSVGGSTFLVDKIYHDPLPLTVEELTGETSDINYSCFFEVRARRCFSSMSGGNRFRFFRAAVSLPSPIPFLWEVRISSTAD